MVLLVGGLLSEQQPADLVASALAIGEAFLPKADHRRDFCRFSHRGFQHRLSLPALPLLVTQSSNRIRRQLDKFFYEGGTRPNIYFESNSQHLLCILAEKGMGLAVVSPVILYTKWEAIDKNASLAAFPLCRELPENVLSLVYRKDEPMPQYARDFIRVVREVFTVYGRLLDLEEQARVGGD